MSDYKTQIVVIAGEPLDFLPLCRPRKMEQR